MATKAFEEGDFTLCLFLDIKKAFDTVKIDLLKKHNIYGIWHTALKMPSSYLSDRTQRVVIGNTHSNFKSITMGVPQGSVLGPIIFLLYINDFLKISPRMTCLSYADDIPILFKNKDINELQETVTATMLQVSDWFSANFLSLNVSKTYTQHYATRSPSP